MTPGALGRLPHSPARLATAPSLARHTFGTLAPLPRLDRSGIQFTPGLYDNQILPNCTAVALANHAGAAAALDGYDLAIVPAKVPAFYGDTIGLPGATEAQLTQTAGAVALDVLAYQTVYGLDLGLQAPLVALWGTIDPADRAALANGVARLGGGYWGVDLCEADMAMPPVWDAAGDPGAVVGGHMVLAWDYTGLRDGDTVRIGTWGAWQPATWRWVRARLREPYGLVWPSLAPAASFGVDQGRLAEEIGEWTREAG